MNDLFGKKNRVRPGLVIGIPSRGAVSIDWTAYFYEMLSWLPPAVKMELQYTRGLPVVEARQQIAEYAVRVGARHLLFIDDDTFPPANGLLQLWNARVPICSGVYFDKPPLDDAGQELAPPQSMIFKEPGAGPWVELMWLKKGLYEVSSGGAGFLLISTEVFKKMEKPWFAEEQRLDGGTVVKMGEDTFFWEKAGSCGFKRWVNTKVLCLHADTQFSPDGRTSLKLYPRKEIVQKWEHLTWADVNQPMTAPAGRLSSGNGASSAPSPAVGSQSQEPS